MDPIWIAIAALGGYLIGSISFARIVTRLVTGQDVTQFEVPVDNSAETYKAISIGGNTVASKLGKKYGMITGILDMLKATLPVLALKLIFPGQPYHLIYAVTCMAGHIWPVYYRFHGGSGWSVAIGGLLAVDWLGALVTPVLGLVLGMFVLRMVPVAIVAWIWLVIPWLWLRTHDSAHLWYAIAINVLFVLSMGPIIRDFYIYWRQGKLLDYGRGYLNSNPMTRGFMKMGEMFKAWRP